MDQIVTVLSDILLGAGALGAAVYCGVLANRLKRFNNLENGVGGAVALLSAQVDDMTRTLDLARKAAGQSTETLTALTERAESASRKLELMLASLNDLPDVAAADPGSDAAEPAPEPTPAEAPAREAAGESEQAQDAAWTTAAKEIAEVEAGDAPVFLSRRSRVREGAA